MDMNRGRRVVAVRGTVMIDGVKHVIFVKLAVMQAVMIW